MYGCRPVTRDWLQARQAPPDDLQLHGLVRGLFTFPAVQDDRTELYVSVYGSACLWLCLGAFTGLCNRPSWSILIRRIKLWT